MIEMLPEVKLVDTTIMNGAVSIHLNVVTVSIVIHSTISYTSKCSFNWVVVKYYVSSIDRDTRRAHKIGNLSRGTTNLVANRYQIVVVVKAKLIRVNNERDTHESRIRNSIGDNIWWKYCKERKGGQFLGGVKSFIPTKKQ